MKHTKIFLVAIPLIFTITTGAQAGQSGSKTQPVSQKLTAPIASVKAPSRSEFSSIRARSLIDGSKFNLKVGGHKRGIKVRETGGCTWTRPADWFSPSTSWSNCGTSRNWHTATARVRVTNSLYPLKVGATGRYVRSAVSHTGRKHTRTTRCKVTKAVEVLRRGKAATPAFVVACNDGKRLRTTWYAPGIGPIAYREMHKKNGLQEAWVRTN